jgi:hypothetical protein
MQYSEGAIVSVGTLQWYEASFRRKVAAIVKNTVILEPLPYGLDELLSFIL